MPLQSAQIPLQRFFGSYLNRGLVRILPSNTCCLTVATALSATSGNNVYFKREDMQPVFSFKCRGSYNKMVNMTDEEKQKGVVACSAGQ